MTNGTGKSGGGKGPGGKGPGGKDKKPRKVSKKASSKKTGKKMAKKTTKKPVTESGSKSGRMKRGPKKKLAKRTYSPRYVISGFHVELAEILDERLFRSPHERRQVVQAMIAALLDPAAKGMKHQLGPLNDELEDMLDGPKDEISFDGWMNKLLDVLDPP